MLVPQFSLRLLFTILTGGAVVSAILALAMRGSAVAAAISAAILSLAIVAATHVAVFLLVGLFSPLFRARRASGRVPAGLGDPSATPMADRGGTA